MSTSASRSQESRTSMKITIKADGGCSPNPGNMYGSYCIEFGVDEVDRLIQTPLGHGTNNDAEFLILGEALDKTISLLILAGIKPDACSVLLLSDSKIVVNRINAKYKPQTEADYARLARRYGPKAVDATKRMNLRTEDLLKKLIKFPSYAIKWQSRERNVENFGH